MPLFERVEIGPHVIYLGDCLEVLPTLSGVDAVVTDPPYGVKNNCDYTRFTGGLAPNHHHQGIHGDDEPFDPSPWLKFRECVMWGFQYFARHLPMGSTLIWNKKRDNQLGTFLSDAELAWMKGGVGAYIFNHVWHGFDRQTERGGEVLHPSQKPIALFQWCLSKIKGRTILDPYMGSNPCGVACVRSERRFIGIEKEPKYFDIACKRIQEAMKAEPLWQEACA